MVTFAWRDEDVVNAFEENYQNKPPIFWFSKKLPKQLIFEKAFVDL